MTLPGTWQTKCESHVKEYFLCDPCDLASMSFKVRRFQYEPRDLEPGGRIFEQVERAKRWRDGSPVGGLEMEIERQQKMLGTMKTGECRAALLRAFVENLVKLCDERSKLQPMPNVFGGALMEFLSIWRRNARPIFTHPSAVS